MVLAIEPAIYIPKKVLQSGWENILITDQGCKVLSEIIPLKSRDRSAVSNK